MIGTLSAERTLSLRESAPICMAPAARRQLPAAPPACAPKCYRRLVLCNFKSTFDEYAPPMAPWRAAQRVAASLSKRPVDAAAALAMSPRAGRHAGGRGDGGGDGGGASSVAACLCQPHAHQIRAQPVEPRGLLQRCACGASDGRRARRVRRARFARRASRPTSSPRAADVLVGTHGAGLSNAFFLRRGGALVEARPYNFEGAWPDRYFRALTALERSVHYYQVSAGSPALSIPTPPENEHVGGEGPRGTAAVVRAANGAACDHRGWRRDGALP